MGKPLNIAFFVRHFSERGTEVAIYDYAKYNQTILGNKSLIVCFTLQKQQSIGFDTVRHSYDKFGRSFPIIEINDITEMSQVIWNYNLDFFYALVHGEPGDIYKFENKAIWGNCKTIKHCVFDTRAPEADFHISIGVHLNEKFHTNIPVIPHIVTRYECDGNLRKEFGIPENAIVIGRYGGTHDFNIHFVYQAIHNFLMGNNNVYFLFMNTNPFYNHPRIIHLGRSVDLEYKAKFVNTCDAMIHARRDGETFGLSVAEFSVRNKPVITCNCGDIEHLKILGDKAVVYSSAEQLIWIFNNIERIIHSRSDWNAYQRFSPENVMGLFQTLIFSKV